MGIAVSLWFEQALEQRIRAIWADIASEGISNSMHEGPYRPHITLGVWGDANPDAVLGAIKPLVREQRAFDVCLGSVGSFPGGEGVLFLAPIVTRQLLGLHADVQAALNDVAMQPHPYYGAGAWNPHCTIACRVERAKLLRGVDRLLSTDMPIYGKVVALGIIDTPAEIELSRIELPR